MMLTDPYLDNSLGESWDIANILFGSGDYGTPGEANYVNDCVYSLGDINGDGEYNVLDIVALVNCVLSENCGELVNSCASDLNADGVFNILDVVALVNCVLLENCGN